jgi:Peptidase C13 family
VIARSIRVVYAASWLRTGALTAVVTLGSLAVNWALPPSYWYPAQEADAAEPPRHWIDTEQTYYAQHRLVGEALAALKPARRGVTELYFVGFAGTATQDVFMKEVRSARQLFDERFGTRDRSLVLVNNPRTVDQTPIASISNLRQVLAGVAAKMNVTDDILFLFLTSHGSPGRFSVHFPALALDDLSDRELKDMLDRSGIKWRIVVISACYSGSFIDALKDERTLILTAAAADKTSFGCSNENDFTYFGDAYINTALRQDRSFVAAFDRAKDIIARREAAENLTPSEPQIYLGAAMQAKLQQLERRLAKRPAAAMSQ